MLKLTEFDQLLQHNPAGASRRLLGWLAHDPSRAQLYREMIDARRVLAFPSCANSQDGGPADARPEYHQTAYLVVCREHIEQAFTDSEHFSNAPFRALGSGTFMLALDRGDEHTAQRAFARQYLALDDKVLHALCALAFKAGAALALKQRRFDLAAVAEQIAVRYVGSIFGFAHADHPLLEASMRAAYRGLSYQMMARHFVSEPATLVKATEGMAALLRRVAELIGLYQQPIGRDQTEERRRLDDELQTLREFANKDHPARLPLQHFQPVLRRIAQPESKDASDYSVTELGIVVVGLIAGAIGNIQASICIAIQQFFQLPDPQQRDQVLQAAQDAWLSHPEEAAPSALDAHIWEALRLNPPAAFLPRQAKKNIFFGASSHGRPDIPQGAIMVLGVGGATRDADPASDHFQMPAPGAPGGARHRGACPHAPEPRLIFGGALQDERYIHSCVGQDISMPLVQYAVRQLLLLPGLAEGLDPQTAQPLGLQKLWGYNCMGYPLEYQRMALLRHSALNVVMRVKSPVAVHAEALKGVIAYGAPLIEKVLADAKHIHFAWFQFQDHDSELALHTIYDRDFDSYIEHFALQVGPLFDAIFEHIENAPPLPVKDFPREFVDTIRLFNQPPVAGYLFSAYPKTEAHKIMQHFSQQNRHEFNAR